MCVGLSGIILYGLYSAGSPFLLFLSFALCVTILFHDIHYYITQVSVCVCERPNDDDSAPPLCVYHCVRARISILLLFWLRQSLKAAAAPSSATRLSINSLYYSPRGLARVNNVKERGEGGKKWQWQSVCTTTPRPYQHAPSPT